MNTKKITAEENIQPNEIEVGNLVIAKLAHDEYWANPRNRKTRIVVEMLMRSCYLTGWNNRAEYSDIVSSPLKAKIEELEKENTDLLLKSERLENSFNAEVAKKERLKLICSEWHEKNLVLESSANKLAEALKHIQTKIILKEETTNFDDAIHEIVYNALNNK